MNDSRKTRVRIGAVVAAFASVTSFACSPASGGAAPGENPQTGAGGADTGSGGTISLGSGGDQSGIIGGGQGGSTERGTGGGDGCGTNNYKSTLLPSSILFLVDRSGSMNCNLPDVTPSADCEMHPQAADPAKPTKWGVIKGALSTALDKLAEVPGTSVGLSFFSNDNACGVSSKPSVDVLPLAKDGPQLNSLKAALEGVTPKGGTPIIGSVILGFKHLHQQAQAPGNRFVVLVTDGADSCIAKYADQGVTGDPKAQLLQTELPKAHSVNIRTFVIGAPGSEPARSLLSQIAFAGDTGRNDGACEHEETEPAAGKECHFDMTRSADFGADLTAALQKITGQAATCDFDVPTATDGKRVDTTKLNVDYFKAGGTAATDKTELVKDDSCASTSPGWFFLDATKTKIRLCPTMCQTVQGDPKANVNVSLSCEKQRIPR